MNEIDQVEAKILSMVPIKSLHRTKLEVTQACLKVLESNKKGVPISKAIKNEGLWCAQYYNTINRIKAKGVLLK